MKSVIIGIPTRGGDLQWSLVMWLLKQARRTDIKTGFNFCACPISARRAQEGNINRMWSTDTDYYMTLDTDVIPPDDAIDKMIACDKDVVVAPIWHFDPPTKEIHLNIHYKSLRYRSYIPKDSGIEKIAYSSFGCVLMKKHVRDVFNAAKENPIRWSNLLDVEVENTNVENDNIFFGKCIKLGIDVYVCWDVKGLVHNRRVALCDETIASYNLRAKLQCLGKYSPETGVINES